MGLAAHSKTYPPRELRYVEVSLEDEIFALNLRRRGSLPLAARKLALCTIATLAAASALDAARERVTPHIAWASARIRLTGVLPARTGSSITRKLRKRWRR
jgi:hypothetical protein